MKLKNILIITLMTTFFIILGTKAYATTGKINKDSAKLRKEPNSKVVLDLLEKNSEVEVLEEKDGWYKIKAKTSLGKVTGYVSDSEIKIEGNNNDVEEPSNKPEEKQEEEPVQKPEEKPVEEPAEELVEKTETTETVAPVVTTGKIEEDKQYSLSQEVAIKALPLINSIEKAKISGNITVVEIINDWARIESDSDSGWVRIKALKGVLTSSSENSNVQSTEDAQENQEEQVQAEEVKPENVEQKQEEPKKEETKEPEKPAETKLNKVGYISTEGLRVRKGPSTDTEEITSLSKNDKVEIIGQSGKWYKIKIDGEEGYVSSKYVSDTKLPETTSRGGSTIRDNNTQQTENKPEQKQEEVPQTQEKPTETPAPAPEPSTSTTGIAIVEFAKKYLGHKYVYGGTSPVTGFDCSGFTQYVYKQFGISISRSSKGQAKNGVPVDKNNLQPGDLLIFNNNANTQIGHVGIYMGDGNFIHASDAKTGVKITSLSAPNHAKKYVGARRVIN